MSSGGDVPALFDIQALRQFHVGMLGELDRFLEGVKRVPGSHGSEYEEDNIRAFEQVKMKAMELAGKAYIAESADSMIVSEMGREYPPNDDILHSIRAITQMTADTALNNEQVQAVEKFVEILHSYEGLPFVHPRSLQLPRVRAALTAASDAASAASRRMPNINSDDADSVDDSESGYVDTVGHHAVLKSGAEKVAGAEHSRAEVVELSVRNDAIQASAGEYAEVARSSAKYADVAHRAAEVMRELCEGDPCGLLGEHAHSAKAVKELSDQVKSLRKQAQTTLEEILLKYNDFTNITKEMCNTAKQCRLNKATANHVEAALHHFESLVANEAALFEEKSEGAAATVRLAESTAQFVRDFTSLTAETLERHGADVDRRVSVSQAALHMSAHRYFQVLKAQEDQEKQVIDLVDQKQSYANLRSTNPEVATALAHERQSSLTKIQQIGAEIDKLRALLDHHGVNEAMRRQQEESFLDVHDRGQRESEGEKFFSKIVSRVKDFNDYVAELSDTPRHAVSIAWEQESAKKAMKVLYGVLVAASDANAALSHARELSLSVSASLTSKLKRHTRSAAQIFTELNDVHPSIVKSEGTAYALPDGGRANCMYLLATPTFSCLEACVRILTSASTNPSSLVNAAASASNAAFTPPNPVAISFDNVSPRLYVKQSVLTKLDGRTNVADSSALCVPQMPGGSGVHSWSVRILNNADHLMIGVADGAMPVTGYCNSVQYPRGYFLNVTTGTLWSSALRYSGRSYWPEPMDEDDDIITIVLDTTRGTVTYAHNGRDLGVAFVGVDTSRPLQPAFEVTTAGCSFELLPP